VRQCGSVVVQEAVCGCVRAAVCGSARGSVWHCVAVTTVVSAQCALQCAAVQLVVCSVCGSETVRV
jgi:hypothetical protein